MNEAIVLHTLLRLARPGTLITLIVFVLVYPTAIVALISRIPSASFDFEALSNLIYGPIMINLVALTFVSGSIGNTKSLDDGEYLALLFSRPIYRWLYVISKWLTGFLVVAFIVCLQTALFIGLLNFIGRGDLMLLGFTEIANIMLNSLQASALVVMIFAFPSRIGAMIFVFLIYFSFAVPLLFKAIPNGALLLNGNLQYAVNLSSDCVRSFTYTPLDLDPYFNSVQLLWLPVITFLSNVILYVWIAVFAMNNREFFYTN